MDTPEIKPAENGTELQNTSPKDSNKGVDQLHLLEQAQKGTELGATSMPLSAAPAPESTPDPVTPVLGATPVKIYKVLENPKQEQETTPETPAVEEVKNDQEAPEKQEVPPANEPAQKGEPAQEQQAQQVYQEPEKVAPGKAAEPVRKFTVNFYAIAIILMILALVCLLAWCYTTGGNG